MEAIKGTHARVGSQVLDVRPREVPKVKRVYWDRVLGYNPDEQELEVQRTETVTEGGIFKSSERYEISFKTSLDEAMETFGEKMMSNGRKRVYDTSRPVSFTRTNGSRVRSFAYVDESATEALNRLSRELDETILRR